MIKRTLSYLSDAGHAWLSVSLTDIRTLGLTAAFSRYSYMNGTRAYLEEDCDAPIFLKRAKELGWVVHIKDTQCESTHSWIRNLPTLTPGRIEIPITIGSELILDSGDDFSYRVVGNTGKQFIVIGGKNARTYGIPVSNPFEYVTQVLS